jgi:uncharacterized protein (DUF488 family)
MNPPHALYTVGHSSQSIEELIGRLQPHGIETLADVRSVPYSRRYPHFSREALQKSLIVAGIRYLFLGRELGARRDESECYHDERVSYEEILRLPNFQRGIEMLLAAARQRRLAIMCAEQDPLTCHRTILISRELLRHDLEIRHIGPQGGIETHRDAERRLIAEELGGSDQGDLFPGDVDDAVRLQQAYSRRAHRIAYRRNAPRLMTP